MKCKCQKVLSPGTSSCFLLSSDLMLSVLQPWMHMDKDIGLVLWKVIVERVVSLYFLICCRWNPIQSVSVLLRDSKLTRPSMSKVRKLSMPNRSQSNHLCWPSLQLVTPSCPREALGLLVEEMEVDYLSKHQITTPSQTHVQQAVAAAKGRI